MAGKQGSPVSRLHFRLAKMGAKSLRGLCVRAKASLHSLNAHLLIPSTFQRPVLGPALLYYVYLFIYLLKYFNLFLGNYKCITNPISDASKCIVGGRPLEYGQPPKSHNPEEKGPPPSSHWLLIAPQLGVRPCVSLPNPFQNVDTFILCRQPQLL